MVLHSALHPIPPARASQVWLDFDGTISRVDVLDELIKRFAVNDSWQVAERCWQEGRIGSRECLQAQFAAVRIDPTQLRDFLSTIQLDAGFVPLLNLLRAQNVPVAILSDGSDLIINGLLSRNGITDIPVRSNSLLHREKELTMSCPHGSTACESAAAHCKCASVRALQTQNRRSIYVGDGRSDLCVARKCEVIFAKSTLAACLTREQRHFVKFDTLGDIVQTLGQAWTIERPATVSNVAVRGAIRA